MYGSLFLFSNLLIQSQPLVIGLILNHIQDAFLGGAISQDSLWSLIGMISVIVWIQIGFWALHGPARVIEMSNAFVVRANYKSYLLRGAMALPIKWHNENHSGDTFDKVEKGTTALFHFSEGTFWIIEGILMLIISYVMLVTFNIHASYIVLIILTIVATFVLRFDKVLVEKIKSLNHDENAISAKVYDAISNITTVIILRIEKLVHKGILKKIWFPYDKHNKYLRLNEVKWALVGIVSTFMEFLVLASYIIMVYKSGDALMIGNLFILYGYSRNVREILFRFAWQYGQTMKFSANVMNAEEIAENFNDAKKNSRKVNMKNWKFLLIDSLSFHYHDEEKDLHLHDVSLNVKRKEKVALIGESGCGKTTLLKVMRELYNPKSVNIYLDGQRITRGFRNLSPHISLIPQDPEIFNTTIKENITMGIRHTKSYIQKFTDLACFTKVIPTLPKGIDSEINEKGVNLSGGQKQRLALSRGLMASTDKELILLDEATSSVDPANERRVYKNILREFKSKTIIATLHRLHLLPLFDRVIMMDKGRIIAEGTFDELMEHPKFKKMWKKSKSHQEN
jgi:ATP-binding cassette, subfamily B, bacterial